MNKVVARYANGAMVKGVTSDFLPGRECFHVSTASAAGGTDIVEVRMQDLKAVFFVKELGGLPVRSRRKEFDPVHPAPGRRIRVVFSDGEVLLGTTQGYQPGRQGFFVTPADRDENNERCYVVAASAREVSFV
jgi:hypothetical protein